MSSFLRQFFTRRGVGRLLFAMASLVTLLAVLWVGANWHSRSAWATYRADAARRGVKLDLEAWVPPPIPPEENFYAAPLFQKSNPGKLFESPAVNGIQRWFGDFEKPTDLEEIRRAYLSLGLLEQASDDPAADVLQVLDATFGEALTALREAERRPRARLNWEAESWMARESASNVLIRAALLHSLRSAAHAARHDGQASFDELQAVIRIVRVEDDPTSLLHAMLRGLMASLATGRIWEGIAARVWDDGQLAMIESELRPFDFIADFARGVEAERAFMNRVIDDLSGAYGHRGEELFSARRSGNLGAGLSWKPEFWFRQNQLWLNRWHDAFQMQFDPAGGQLRPFSAPKQSPWCSLANLVLRYFRGHLDTVVSVQTQTQEARLACALERHFLASGTYPETLDALVPHFIPAIPSHVKTGEPIHYRRLEGERRYRLQAGPSDSDDDGNNVAARAYHDCVWQYPATGDRNTR